MMIVQTYSKEYNNIIIHIANRCFGNSFITEDSLEAFTKSDCQSFIIKSKDEIIGFCLLKIESRNSIQPEFKPYIPNKHKIGIIQTIAVLPEYQQQGFGSFLLKHCLNHLLHQKCDDILYPAWIENNKDYFLNKLKSIGFAPIKTFHHFWKRDSLKENYSCIKCGEPPCSCSLKLYKLIQ